MKLIVGLGNYGKEYQNTRHNVGFLAVRWLAGHWQEEANWTLAKQQAYTLKSQEKALVLAQPTTMMNKSGQAVRALMDYYKIDISDLIVIHDDADLELGTIKVVDATATGAGHHGVLSVIEHVSHGFKRIRIGIGRPDQPVRDIANWVLKPLSKEDKSKLINVFEKNLVHLLNES